MASYYGGFECRRVSIAAESRSSNAAC